jgi:hypothetical protein
MPSRSLYRPGLFYRLLFAGAMVLAPLIRAFPVAAYPGPSGFGYGARIDLQGSQVQLALNAAAGISLDWVGIDFNWALLWPGKDRPIDLEAVQMAMSLAQQQGLKVLLSITGPPAWALTSAGPDPRLTAELVTKLAARFPGTLHAIELFPAANTTRGWGATPNPLAYAAVLQAAQTAILAAGSQTAIIAAGLNPLPPGGALHSQPGDMDDLVFLQGLYQAGAASWMPYLGIRMTEIISSPMQTLDGKDPRVLRHYEEIRQVMLKNEHPGGKIWVTAFTWPAEAVAAAPNEQVQWLTQSLILMKSQLYIDVAFFDGLNPPADASPAATGSHSLIQADLSLHPAFAQYGQLIAMDRSGQPIPFQPILTKRITSADSKDAFKRNQP